MLHGVIDFGGPQQCLGWDAAPVETDSSEIFALDNSSVQAELRATDRRDISSGTRAQDYNIIIPRNNILRSTPSDIFGIVLRLAHLTVRLRLQGRTTMPCDG